MRWSDTDDKYLVAYFNAVGAERIGKDLKRSKSSVIKRAQKLRDTGAWVAWEMVTLSELYARILSGTQSKKSVDFIQDELAEMEAIGWDIPNGWLKPQQEEESK